MRHVPLSTRPEQSAHSLLWVDTKNVTANARKTVFDLNKPIMRGAPGVAARWAVNWLRTMDEEGQPAAPSTQGDLEKQATVVLPDAVLLQFCSDWPLLRPLLTLWPLPTLTKTPGDVDRLSTDNPAQTVLSPLTASIKKVWRVRGVGWNS